MRKLVSNIQELQSLDDRKRTVEVAPIALREVFDEASVVFEERLRAKEISLEVTCPGDLKVLGEMLSLSNSVVNNIVSNAIKFSFRGGRIVVEAKPAGGSVLVTIRDEGLGMSPELLSKIFLRSEKTSRPGTGGEKGTGFGMPIVKRYMELFGGAVGVESVPYGGSAPSGTTFTLTFRSA